MIATAVSPPYPGLLHADSKAVTAALEQHGTLEGAVLYVGLENCLMCLGVAYWAGIRDIYYAVPRTSVSSDYYETAQDTTHIADNFNSPVRRHHVPELQEEALKVVRDWEKQMGF